MSGLGECSHGRIAADCPKCADTWIGAQVACFALGHSKPGVLDQKTWVLAADASHSLAITGRVQLYKCGRCCQLVMVE